MMMPFAFFEPRGELTFHQRQFSQALVTFSIKS
jgi:hypothetical protein